MNCFLFLFLYKENSITKSYVNNTYAKYLKWLRMGRLGSHFSGFDQ